MYNTNHKQTFHEFHVEPTEEIKVCLTKDMTNKWYYSLTKVSALIDVGKLFGHPVI